MQTIALVVHVFLALGVIGLVLIQHGKGADAGAAFGSGASATVFGSRGSGSFLTRMTTLFALAFFGTSILLFYMASKRTGAPASVVDGIDIPQVEAPAAPVTDTPALDADLPAVQNTDTPAVSQPQSDLPAAPAASE